MVSMIMIVAILIMTRYIFSKHLVIANDVNDHDNCHDDNDPYIFSKHPVIVNDVNDHDNCHDDHDPLYI